MGHDATPIKRTRRAPTRCHLHAKGLVFSRFSAASGPVHLDLHAIHLATPSTQTTESPGPQCLERAQACGNVQL